MTQRDMTAHKLVAMYERVEKTKRDLFDVWFMLKKIWPINEEVITLRTNLSMKYFYKELVKKLESIPDNKILDGLGELLTTEQKDWVKDHLRKETRFLLESKMEEIKMSERIDNL
jgi:hypothetical protein